MPVMSSSKFERPAICTADGCDRKSFGRGLCSKHYKVEWRAGRFPIIHITRREKLEKLITVNPENGCWEWRWKLDRLGYGRMSFGGKKVKLAHRIAYEEHIGPIPDGMCVCHRCDNRKCCNPQHLFLATHQENMADRDAKRRGKIPAHPKGLNALNAVLSAEQVRLIRQSSGSLSEIGREFGIHRHTVKNVRLGLTYTDVS